MPVRLMEGDIHVGTTVDGLYHIIFRPVSESDPQLQASGPVTPPPRPPPPLVRTFPSDIGPECPASPVTVKMEVLDSPESPDPSPPCSPRTSPSFVVCQPPAIRLPPPRPPPPVRHAPPTQTSSTLTTATPDVEVMVERIEPIGVRVTTRVDGDSTGSSLYPDLPRPEPSAPPMEILPPRGMVRMREESPLDRNVRQRLDVNSSALNLVRAYDEVVTRSEELLNFIDRDRVYTPLTPVTPLPRSPARHPPEISSRSNLTNLRRPVPVRPRSRQDVDINLNGQSSSPYSDVTIRSTVSSPPGAHINYEDHPYLDEDIYLSDAVVSPYPEENNEIALYDPLQDIPPWSSTPPPPCDHPTHRTCLPVEWGQVCPAVQQTCNLCCEEDAHHTISCRRCNRHPGCCRCIWAYQRSRYNAGCPLCRYGDSGEYAPPRFAVTPSMRSRARVRTRGGAGRLTSRGQQRGRRPRRSPPPER